MNLVISLKNQIMLKVGIGALVPGKILRTVSKFGHAYFQESNWIKESRRQVLITDVLVTTYLV